MSESNHEAKPGKPVKNNGISHMLKMLACCLIPIILLGILLSSGSYNSYLPYLILLLCPLMHLFMMRDHEHGGHDDGAH